MFISATNFKKLIKKSWAAEGLTMGATDTEIFLAGGSWVIRVLKTEIPNKIKAAIVELTGELPAVGEVFTCYKKEATQYEVAENEYWNIGERFANATVPFKVTKVKVEHYGHDMRVLQDKVNNCMLINDFFIDVIDYTATEERESMPVGPVTEHPSHGMVYWKNNYMAFAVCRVSVNGDTETEKALDEFVKRMEADALPAYK